MWLCVAEFYTPEGAHAWAIANSGEWISRSGRHWAGVLAVSPPSMTVDTEGVGYNGNREDWIEYSEDSEEFTLRHASEIARLLFGAKRIPSSVRLSDYLSEDQLKMSIDLIPFNTLRPRPIQKRINRWGLQWKTHHCAPEDLERNAFGALVPTNNRTFEDIALFTEEYNHMILPEGPVAKFNTITYWNKNGTVYKSVNGSELSEQYEGAAIAEQGANRRNRVVSSAQALAIKAIKLWAVATQQAQVTDGRAELVTFLEDMSVAAGKNVIEEYKLKDDPAIREQLDLADVVAHPWLNTSFANVLGVSESVLNQLKSEFRDMNSEVLDENNMIVFGG